MIKTFRDKDTQRIFERERVRPYTPALQRLAQRKLEMLNAADTLDDLKVPPGNRLKSLSGSRKGQYSIRINDQWRICFSWDSAKASDVEIVDYH